MLTADLLGTHVATRPISQFWWLHAKIDVAAAHRCKTEASIPVNFKESKINDAVSIDRKWNIRKNVQCTYVNRFVNR